MLLRTAMQAMTGITGASLVFWLASDGNFYCLCISHFISQIYKLSTQCQFTIRSYMIIGLIILLVPKVPTLAGEVCFLNSFQLFSAYLYTQGMSPKSVMISVDVSKCIHTSKEQISYNHEASNPPSFSTVVNCFSAFNICNILLRAYFYFSFFIFSIFVSFVFRFIFFFFSIYI